MTGPTISTTGACIACRSRTTVVYGYMWVHNSDFDNQDELLCCSESGTHDKEAELSIS